MRTAPPGLAQLVRKDVHGMGDRVQLIAFRRQRYRLVQIAGRKRLERRENALHSAARKGQRRVVVRHLRSHSIAVGSLVNSRVGIPVLAIRKYTLPIMRPSGLAFTRRAIALKSARTVPE